VIRSRVRDTPSKRSSTHFSMRLASRGHIAFSICCLGEGTEKEAQPIHVGVDHFGEKEWKSIVGKGKKL
jgi:hypothetical protein